MYYKMLKWLCFKSYWLCTLEHLPLVTFGYRENNKYASDFEVSETPESGSMLNEIKCHYFNV